MRRLLAASLLVLLSAAPASAHVIVDTDNRNPGAKNLRMVVLVQSEYPDGTLSGTGPGSPTTKIVLHLPDGVRGITPVTVPGWSVKAQGQVVTWSAGSLASGRSAAFDLRIAQLPDETSLSLPVEQSYADGRVVDWHDVPTGTHPAPVLALDGSTGVGGITSITQPTGSKSSSHLGLILGVGGLAVLVVGAAVLLTRRRPKP